MNSYFSEDPVYTFEGKNIDPNHLYSADYYVRYLPLVGGFIKCDISTHTNMFHYYESNNQIRGMFCLWGGSDTSRYYNPISIMSGEDSDKYGHCIACSAVEQWITGVWDKVCKKEGIPLGGNYGTSRSRNDDDISVIEFMDILEASQETFKNYKALPKRN